MELWIQIEEKNKLLDRAINDLAKNGYDLTEKERRYKIAVNKKVLELRAENMPVTLIQLSIYGYDEIAQLRFERDNAEVKYNSNQEYINLLKLQIRILESQLNREYTKG